MAIHVNIGEAKTRFSELCAAVLRGEDVIVQKAGVPSFKLVPINRAPELTRAEISAMRKANMGKWGTAEGGSLTLAEIKALRGDPVARSKAKFGNLLS